MRRPQVGGSGWCTVDRRGAKRAGREGTGSMGSSFYESLFISAGQNGWDLAEPGNYLIQIALHSHDEEQDIISNPLHLRIAPPHGYDEELLAQDFFSEDVGRILTFNGSQILTTANDTLREVAERLGERVTWLRLGCAGNGKKRVEQKNSYDINFYWYISREASSVNGYL